jgi:hypothetical protein
MLRVESGFHNLTTLLQFHFPHYLFDGIFRNIINNVPLNNYMVMTPLAGEYYRVRFFRYDGNLSIAVRTLDLVLKYCYHDYYS